MRSLLAPTPGASRPPLPPARARSRQRSRRAGGTRWRGAAGRSRRGPPRPPDRYGGGAAPHSFPPSLPQGRGVSGKEAGWFPAKRRPAAGGHEHDGEGRGGRMRSGGRLAPSVGRGSAGPRRRCPAAPVGSEAFPFPWEGRGMTACGGWRACASPARDSCQALGKGHTWCRRAGRTGASGIVLDALPFPLLPPEQDAGRVKQSICSGFHRWTLASQSPGASRLCCQPLSCPRDFWHRLRRIVAKANVELALCVSGEQFF